MGTFINAVKPICNNEWNTGNGHRKIQKKSRGYPKNVKIRKAHKDCLAHSAEIVLQIRSLIIE